MIGSCWWPACRREIHKNLLTTVRSCGACEMWRVAASAKTNPRNGPTSPWWCGRSRAALWWENLVPPNVFFLSEFVFQSWLLAPHWHSHVRSPWFHTVHEWRLAAQAVYRQCCTKLLRVWILPPTIDGQTGSSASLLRHIWDLMLSHIRSVDGKCHFDKASGLDDWRCHGGNYAE